MCDIVEYSCICGISCIIRSEFRVTSSFEIVILNSVNIVFFLLKKIGMNYLFSYHLSNLLYSYFYFSFTDWYGLYFRTKLGIKMCHCDFKSIVLFLLHFRDTLHHPLGCILVQTPPFGWICSFHDYFLDYFS